MPRIRGTILQTGVDAFTQDTIITDLTPDGKTGWEITSIKVFLDKGYTIPTTADWITSVILQTTIGVATLPNNVDEIARIVWANSFTTQAVSGIIELVKETSLVEPRLTVQPNLYMGLSSTGTGVANECFYEINYQTVKLNDLELLRLLIGGA